MPLSSEITQAVENSDIATIKKLWRNGYREELFSLAAKSNNIEALDFIFGETTLEVVQKQMVLLAFKDKAISSPEVMNFIFSRVKDLDVDKALFLKAAEVEYLPLVQPIFERHPEERCKLLMLGVSDVPNISSSFGVILDSMDYDNKKKLIIDLCNEYKGKAYGFEFRKILEMVAKLNSSLFYEIAFDEKIIDGDVADMFLEATQFTDKTIGLNYRYALFSHYVKKFNSDVPLICDIVATGAAGVLLEGDDSLYHQFEEFILRNEPVKKAIFSEKDFGVFPDKYNLLKQILLHKTKEGMRRVILDDVILEDALRSGDGFNRYYEIISESAAVNLSNAVEIQELKHSFLFNPRVINAAKSNIKILSVIAEKTKLPSNEPNYILLKRYFTESDLAKEDKYAKFSDFSKKEFDALFYDLTRLNLGDSRDRDIKAFEEALKVAHDGMIQSLYPDNIANVNLISMVFRAAILQHRDDLIEPILRVHGYRNKRQEDITNILLSNPGNFFDYNSVNTRNGVEFLLALLPDDKIRRRALDKMPEAIKENGDDLLRLAHSTNFLMNKFGIDFSDILDLRKKFRDVVRSPGTVEDFLHRDFLIADSRVSETHSKLIRSFRPRDILEEHYNPLISLMFSIQGERVKGVKEVRPMNKHENLLNWNELLIEAMGRKHKMDYLSEYYSNLEYAPSTRIRAEDFRSASPATEERKR